MNPDHRDILDEFCAAQVRFLLVGAYALATHGLVRATGDIDLWVECGTENAHRIMQALSRFGAPMDTVEEADFYEPGIVFQMGLPPHRIDIITKIDGVVFAEAWESRVPAMVEGLTIFTLSRQHLLRNKESTGRAKDSADAAWLRQNMG
ncbi:MAG TPA: hypothetical protein VM490_11230 [Armatimonadaceae bacterium]|jgi:hypothetical protein|nr:hypothetical protein [Armatimonadaceae bacterium]